MYIVIELQTDATGHTSHIVTDHDTKASAESKYHSILAAAAQSNVHIHSATILTPKGYAQKNESYEHAVEEE